MAASREPGNELNELKRRLDAHIEARQLGESTGQIQINEWPSFLENVIALIQNGNRPAVGFAFDVMRQLVPNNGMPYSQHESELMIHGIRFLDRVNRIIQENPNQFVRIGGGRRRSRRTRRHRRK
jgi:hypothetical protein